MKVSVVTLQMPPAGWELELEVDINTTIARLKELIASQAGAPKITPSTRVLQKTGTAMMSLTDKDLVKKRMILMDPSQQKEFDTQAASKSVAAVQPKSATLQPKAATLQPKAATLQPQTAAQQTPFSKAPQAPAAMGPATLAMKAAAPVPKAASKQAAKAPAGGAKPQPRLIGPSLNELDASMRGRLLEFAGKNWVVGRTPSSASTAGSRLTAVSQKQVIESLNAVIGRAKEAEGKKYYAPVATRMAELFPASSDIMENSVIGVPKVIDVVLRAASDLVELMRPVLEKMGWPPTVESCVAFDDAVGNHVTTPEVYELVCTYLYRTVFASETGGYPHLPVVHHMIWTVWMLGNINPLVSHRCYLQHLSLKPLERKRCSYARTIAFTEAIAEQSMNSLYHSIAKTAPKELRRKLSQRVVWIFGATDACEGELARRGYFEDAGVFKGKDSSAMSIYLIWPGTETNGFAGEWPRGKTVQVHTATYDDVANSQVPVPSMIFFFNAGLGTLEPQGYQEVVPRLILALEHRVIPPPFVFLTCRNEAEVKMERALLDVLGCAGVWPSEKDELRIRHLRNLYSGMAGNPDIECDDNGWITGFIHPKFEERRAELNEYQKNPELLLQKVSAKLAVGGETVIPSDSATVSVDGDNDKMPKSPVTFWGILDLKYDPNLPPEQRVKVLETGDGRASRFSGYGAHIKDAVQSEMKMQDTIRRAVMVENKKLYHDIILENGYTHIRPDQEAFPKAYSEDLARQIIARFKLQQDDLCVLKLVNRARGAGVIPVAVPDLDDALKELLQPPGDLEAWFKKQPSDWARRVSWGCFEEQVRHWWSNECPCFVVEQFCQSISTEKNGMLFDGTMRVGFALLREDKDRLPPGWVESEGGPVYVGFESEVSADAEVPDYSKQVLHPWGDPRPWLGLFRHGSMALRIHWLGGYWKLPLKEVDSPDLRDRIVSVAKQGTAPVPLQQLHEVYAMLGDMVPVTFNTQDMSHNSLLKRYKEFPELGAFITTRLACSMRMRDKMKSLDIMRLAQSHISKRSGQPKDLAISYIERNLAVFEAGHGKWAAAAEGWRKSLAAMPCNATTRYLMGLFHLEEKNPEACIQSIEQSLLLDPDFKAPYACLGVAHLQLQNFTEAAQISEAGLKRHPGTVPASYNLGAAKFGMAVQLSARLADPDTEITRLQVLRVAALENLTYARDNKSKEQAWTDDDDRMIEALYDEMSDLGNEKLPCDGWRLVNWRP